MQLSTAQTIAIMVAIVVIMLRVFSFIYCFVFVSAKLSLSAVISKHTCPVASASGLFRVATHPEPIPNESRTNPERIARNQQGITRNLRGITRNLRGITTNLQGITRNCKEFIPFHSLPALFPKNFRQNPCTFQSYCIPLPSLEFLCGALRIDKGRGYMFKPDQHFLLRLWAYFFARNLPHRIRARPLFMRSTPHSVEMQIKIYGGSPSTCFYCPLWRKSIRVLADEEVRAAFFVPLRQPVPDGFGQKG